MFTILFRVMSAIFIPSTMKLKTKLNSLALVRERTITTGEVGANFCGWKVSRGQRNGYLRPYSRLSRPEPLIFLPNSSSIVLTRLSGSRSRLLRKSGSAGN
jgi:hypothetical protein